MMLQSRNEEKIKKGLDADIIRVGLNIRKLREKKRLTQLELAERAGVSRKAIVESENGKVAPSLRTLVQIAKALFVEVVDLVK